MSTASKKIKIMTFRYLFYPYVKCQCTVTSKSQIWNEKHIRTGLSVNKAWWHLNSLSNTSKRFHVTDTTGCVNDWSWATTSSGAPVRTQLHPLRLEPRALTPSLQWAFWQTEFQCLFLYTKKQIFSGFVGSGSCVIGNVRSGYCLVFASICTMILQKSRCLYRAHLWLRYKVQSCAAQSLCLSSSSKQKRGWWAIIPLWVIFSSIFHLLTIPPTHNVVIFHLHTTRLQKPFLNFLRLRWVCLSVCAFVHGCDGYDYDAQYFLTTHCFV